MTAKYEITTEVCKKAEALAAQGLTLYQIAQCLGISRQTLNEKKKEFSVLSDAIKDGQAKGIAQVTNSLMETAKKGNVAAQIFYLKNRDRDNWKDGQDLNVKHSTKHGSVSEVTAGIREMLGDEEERQPEAPITH